MEHNRDGFYCSQPAPKMTRLTDQQWRRVRRPSTAYMAGSSSKSPQTNPPKNNQPSNRPENQQEKNNFPVAIEESEHWSSDAVEFYTNGDAPFCYICFISKKLDRNFWGTLLGYNSNSALSSTHVEAWTVRLMRLRQSKLLKNPGSQLRWTVLPPAFYDEMKVQDSLTALDMAGRKDPYPPFWEVDYVYLPLSIGVGDWLLIRIDMRTMVITQYWTDKRWRNEQRHEIAHYMEMVTLFFGWFLDRINYWENSNHFEKYEISVGLVELDVPQDNGNVANAGVLVCMMMESLVKNKSLLLEIDVEEACVNYRHHMADELYKWRCLASPHHVR